MGYNCRIAMIEDIPLITKIYNQGMEDRIATLETSLRTDAEMEGWFLDRTTRHKVVVIEDEYKNIFGWASLNLFNARCCYSEVVDLSIYIERGMRGKGLGKILLNYLIEVAREQNFHKLVLGTFKSNTAGQRLYKSVGFREVGTYLKHGKLDGIWVDVTIMEKLL